MSRVLPLGLGLVLALPNLAAACESAQWGDWDDPTTWTSCPTPSGVPEAGSDVLVRAADVVFLSRDATLLGVVVVDGELMFDTDLTLGAGALDLSGGRVTAFGITTLQSTGDLVLGELGGPAELTVVAGGVATVVGSVGGSDPLMALDVQAADVVFAVPPGSPSVEVAGALTLGGHVTLAQPTELRGAQVTLHDIDGAYDLNVVAGVEARLTGRVGGVSRPTSLTVGGGPIVLDMASGGTANPSIRVVGTVRFDGPVTLVHNVDVISANQVFASTLDGPFGVISLTTSSLVFEGAVGGDTPLFTLQINTLGTTYVRGGLIDVDSLVNVYNHVVLDGPGGLTTLRGGPVTLGFAPDRTVRSVGAFPQDLVVETASLTLRSQLGTSGAPLGDVDLTGPVRVEGTGARVLGALTLHDGVTVAADTQLYVGDVDFLGGVGSVTSDGATTLGVSSLDPTSEIVVGDTGAGLSLSDADLAALAPQLGALRVGDAGRPGSLRVTTAVTGMDTTLFSGSVTLDDLTTSGLLTVGGGTVDGSLVTADAIVFDSVVAPTVPFVVSGDTTLVGGLDWTEGAPLVVTLPTTLGGPLTATMTTTVPGVDLLVVDNQSGIPLTGGFDGVAEGSTVFGGISATVTYQGGDGDDVVATTFGCPDGDADGVCDAVDLCLGDDATGDTDGDGLCDDRDFGLTGTTFAPGQVVTLSVVNAPPGDRVIFLVGTRLGASPTCHPTYVDASGAPICVALQAPIVVGSAVADAAGGASVSVRVPASVPSGATVYGQAVHQRGGVGDVTPVATFVVQ
ncbi:MAG: hypothetical protein H6733_17105 [Alphaproteobacteria bacterium]|nr:hypothetical protein [Alphaproteobacteria bacterium]